MGSVIHGGEMKAPELARWIATRAVAIIAGVTAVYYGFADNHLDLMGDKGRVRPAAEAQALAQQRFDRQFADSSVAGRYALLFLQGDNHRDYRDTINVGKRDGNNGILGAFTDGDFKYEYGQSCLDGSVYDTRPSHVAAATEDLDSAALLRPEGARVTIIPVAPEAPPLLFNQDGSGLLTPADDSTRQTMAAHGCSPDINTKVFPA